MCVCVLGTVYMVRMYLCALLCMHYPSISVSVFFVCECSLPGGPDCPMRGEQADLLFCLLSGHSSEHWPSPKLKPLASYQTQHRAAPTGTLWHWIICACQLAVNEKVNRYEPGCGWKKKKEKDQHSGGLITGLWLTAAAKHHKMNSVFELEKPLKMFATCFKLFVFFELMWSGFDIL